MRGTIAGIAAVASIWACAIVPSAEGAKHRARCAVRHSRTVALTAQVRVYKRRGFFYGCALKTGRRLRLGPSGTPPNTTAVERFRLLP